MASCWAGVRSPVTVAWVGTGTSPSPGVQVTWAVQVCPQRFPFVHNVCFQLLLYDSFHGLVLVGLGLLLGDGPGGQGGDHIVEVLVVHGHQGLEDAQHQDQAAGELAHLLDGPRGHQGLRHCDDDGGDGDAENPGADEFHVPPLLSRHRRHGGHHGHHQQHRAGRRHGQDQAEGGAQGLDEAGDPPVARGGGRQGGGTLIH